METVYLADDLKLHRKVAVKVLKPDLAAALGPDRFLQEIEIAAQQAMDYYGRFINLWTGADPVLQPQV
jgi:hypothetical protein